MKKLFLLLICSIILFSLISISFGMDLGPISVDIISNEPSGNSMYSAKIKVTNTSGKKINSCYLTCILMDQNKADIGFQSHYVIKRTEGGLAYKDFLYFHYVVSINNPSRVKWILFKIKSIN